MRKKFDELTICDNFMFSKVMRNPEICKKFLELILDVKIRRLEYPEYEKVVDLRYDAKSIRLDIYVEDDQNTIYNLEMQATSHSYLIKRSRYYHDLLDLDQLEKGQEYSELKNSKVIFICCFDPFGRDQLVYNFRNVCVTEPSLELEDGTEKVFVNTKANLDSAVPELKELIGYFNGEKAQTGVVKLIDDEVQKVKKSVRWRREYMTLQIFMDDARREERKAGRAEGRVEGRAEGREEGRVEGEEFAISAVKAILKLNREGCSLTEIASKLELSEAYVKDILDEL